MQGLNTEILLETNEADQPLVQKKNHSNFWGGLDIYVRSLLLWRVWIYMAATDIRRRYRRTIIGPFWVTLSIAIFIGSMGVIFPMLWHTNMKTYLPFFASSYVIWTFVSTVVTEACGTFTDSSALMKQTSLPFCVYANNVVTRNLIVLLHHLTVYLIVLFMFSVPFNYKTLLFFPGITLLCLTGSWIAVLLGIIATRYRDVRQMVVSLLQISMFITPIFWSPSQLGTGLKARLLVELNPLHHFIQIVRAPLLGEMPGMNDWIITSVICLLGWIMTLRLLGKYKKHIVFWL